MTKVLLYSGGMDSWLIDKLWKPDVRLFFDIGTGNNKQELERVKKRGDVEIIHLPLAQFEQKDNNYYLPLRNLHFVLYAAHYGDVICVGATGSSTHRDKNEVFATLCENNINYLREEDGAPPIKVVMPYRGKSKTDILAEYLSQGGDIEECYRETFSCYNPGPNGEPCMDCTSCLSKFTAFYNNGYRFGTRMTEKFIENTLKLNSSGKSEAVELAKKLRYLNKTLYIDFDNTVTEYSQWPYTGNIRKGCKERLQSLKEQGYYLVLYTSRKGRDFIQARQMCVDNELPFDEYVTKPWSWRYIDDRAITFNKSTDNWEDIKIL